MYDWNSSNPYGCNGNYGYDNRYPADTVLLNDIREYIHDELKDSKYYAILAEKAPNQMSKDLLLEFSRDEYTHAQNFMNAYYMLTGQVYPVPPVEEPVVPPYRDALKVRILAETHDYKKYGEQYLRAGNIYMKDLFYMTRTAEAQHAMRIPILLDEIQK